MAHTEADLDRLINEVLDDYKDCNDLPYVCAMIRGIVGRKRIFAYVKEIILKHGMTDIDEILYQIQFAHDWPQD